ncbi:MAG: hypothetical protein ABJB05_07705 [Parafilimonas sp.]
MKKMLSYAACFFIMSSAFAGPGSILIKKFNQTFPNAQQVKWTDSKGGYFVSFYQNENFEKILYDKDGDFNCSWKYTDGKSLPTNIVMILNKKYSAGKILGVTEYTTKDDVSYNIKLSTDSKLYSLDITSDGSVTKEEQYANQNANNDDAKNMHH